MGIKIDGTKGFGSLLETQKARKGEPAKPSTGVRSQDKVEFSSVLKDVGRNREVAAPADPQRAAKIQALREQIESGNYRPDPEKVAASLLRFISGKGEQ